MKFSAQEEYGLRCLLRLAERGEAASLTLGELSGLEGISVSHVAKLMRVLRRAGVVKSTRGKEGGYTLARPAPRINVGETLAALGGRLFDASFCQEHAGRERLCRHTSDCSIRSVWRRLQLAVDGVLGGLSLQDLLRSEEELRQWSPPARALALTVLAPDTPERC
jgi:Rrf2 family protein